MTEQEIGIFRNEFNNIVWLYSKIKHSEEYIKKYTRFDKNESHKNAIIKAQIQKDEWVYRFKVALKGKDYDDWKAFSKQLQVMIAKLTNAPPLDVQKPQGKKMN